MKCYDYKICNTCFHVESPYELHLEKYAPFFSINGQAEEKCIRISLRETEFIVSPAAQYLGETGETAAWQENATIYRQRKDLFRTLPHSLVEYRADDLTEIACTIRKADFSWATGSQYFWTSVALNHVLIHFRTLLFHSSFIEYSGKGIIFTAPSQTGKSTQAELWQKYRGANIINGDKAGVSLNTKATVHGVPFSGTSGICCNHAMPLQAIVVLSQAKDNSICRMAPSEAITALCSNIFIDKLIPVEWSKALNLIIDLVSEVPVYHLACTPDVRAVEALEREITNNL